LSDTFENRLDGADAYLLTVKDEDDRHAEPVKVEDGRGVETEDAEDDDAPGEVDNEEPLYVNAKQYHRILKRRIARQRLEELNRLSRSRKVSLGTWSVLLLCHIDAVLCAPAISRFCSQIVPKTESCSGSTGH